MQLLPCKFLKSDGLGQSSDAISCIHFCTAAGAKVISASWSGTEYDQAMADAISAAGAAGVLFVASAGNRGKSLDVEPSYPAAYGLPNMLVVASVE